MFFICLSSFAQDKKYQSLLWEISDNGLQKKSYIYGTMHVSEKVSYHLSDAFYIHLLNADFVANESEPRTWSELYEMFSFYGKYNYNNAFYTNFYLNPLEKDQLYSLFQNSNYNLTGLLSRTTEAKKEFQEETYLDMFIYRTGRKYNKKTIGLEDVKTSTINIMKAEAQMDKTEVEKNYQALLKTLKNKNYTDVLVDYYREKDLDMIDSLTFLATPKSYLKALLFDRNTEMVTNMEVYMKKGGLFSAIGAAHLPGRKGVIEMLREKGYTVKPIFDEYTEKGKQLKKQIEEKFITPEIKIKTSADGMLIFPVFDVVLDNEGNVDSPDLANGGYLNIKRTFLNDFLNPNNKNFNPKTLDSLFYENIPGEIISKNTYSEKNYLVYDIKNKTKTGNSQHYRYYITPLEIISIVFGGQGNYVRQFEDLIFSKIELKESDTSWKTISPDKGNFKIEIPSYFSYTGNKKDSRNNDDMKIIAHNEKEKSFYFLIEKTLQDNYNLEDSNFELKRIHYEFYNQQKIDSTNTRFDSDKFSFTSKSKIGEKEIILKTLLNGNKYYLLGTIGAQSENSTRFLNSFEFVTTVYNEAYKTFIDSSAKFKIEIPEKQNEHLDFLTEKKKSTSTKNQNHFATDFKTYEFLSASGNLVELTYSQYHKYDSEVNIDSIWNKYRKNISGDIENIETRKLETKTVQQFIEEDAKNTSDFQISKWHALLNRNQKKEPHLTILNETTNTNKTKNFSEFNALVSKENSKQAIKYKAIFYNGSFYTLKTLVEDNYKNNNPFIEKVFNSFQLQDTVSTENKVFSSKIDIFLKDAMSLHDSIRFSALNSIEHLKFEKKDLQKLQYFISQFKFRENETEVLTELYEKIGAVKSPQVISFLEQSYKKPNTNAIIQFAILKALTYQESEKAYEIILSLLEYDLPISDSDYDISGLFNYFERDLDNSQALFPDIFQFYSIKEYHSPIIELTNLWLEKKLVNPKKLKSFNKMLLTNAKLEAKRVKSWKNKQLIKSEEDFYDDFAPTSDLIEYLNILYPFKKEKNIASLFDYAEKLNIENIDIAIARLQMLHENQIDNTITSKILNNEKIRFKGIQMLYKLKQKDLIKIYSSEEIAKYALININSIDTKKDSLELYKTIKTQYNNTDLKYFFFKTHSKEKEAYQYNNQKIIGIAFATLNDNLIINAYSVLSEETYLEEKELEVLMKNVIDKSLNENRIRVTHGKLGEYNSYSDEYEDY